MLHLQDRREQEAMAEESTFLQNVIDSLAEHVAIIDQQGDIVATNRTWDEFAEDRGGTPGPGPNYLRAAEVPSDDVVCETQQALQELLSGERTVVETTYPCHEPGNQQWFRMTATAFEEAGRRRVVVAHRDITATKEAERELRASEQQFRQIAEQVDQVFWIMDGGAERLEYVSPAFEDVWGLSREVLEADANGWMDAVHEDDRDRVRHAFQALPETRYDVEYRIRRPDGEIRWIHDRAFPIETDDGTVQRLVGVATDVTRARQERARQQRLAREEARVEELKQLAFATSHTLRTEVRRIHSFGQLLEKRADARDLDGLAEPLTEILGGANRLSDLHDALREYAEVTRGGLARQPVDLDRLIREILAERSGSLATEDTPGLEALAPVDGDPEQLRRVFAEILDNAIKFHPDRAPTLRIEAAKRDGRARLRLADDGPGFDPAYAEKVFEIFQQLDPGACEGVGIGLTIARRIVENHGGTIHADPVEGEGTAIVVELPLDDG
jgi:PAS domain S-box-containing protein